MRAALFHGSGRDLTVERVPDPTALGGQVLIEVKQAGICGSDLHMAEYDFVAPGTIFGHEFSGVIADVGANVSKKFRVGDRVTANPFDACRTCDACSDGHLSLCSGGTCIGTSIDRPGAYAEYVAVPALGLQRLPSGATFEEGALVEPLAVAYHAVRLANLGRDDRVLVMGGGPIGFAVTLMCRLRGVAALAVSEPSGVRRGRAIDFGATAVIDPLAGSLVDQTVAAIGGPPSVVIECVGNAGRLQDAFDVVARRGLIVVPGACMTEDRIRPTVGLMKEARLQFSMTYTDSDFAAVIELIAKREIEAAALCTRKVPLAQAPEAFRGLAADPQQIKVLIEPGR